jgi:2,4-didehydro-3-deoxy-L-rhamnonate hydrolase
MKLARIEIAGRIATAVVHEDAVVLLEPLFGASAMSQSLDALVRTGRHSLAEIEAFAAAAKPAAPLDQVKLLAPLSNPPKIVAIGSNYPRPSQDIATDGSSAVLFFKPRTALCGPHDPIVLPPEAKSVIGEVELALVIGKSGDRIAPGGAFDHVFGMMVANDVTAPEILLGESNRNPLLLQQSRGKGFRTFCPTGPWIETDVARSFPRGTLIEQRIDDFLEISGDAAEMIVPPAQLLAEISTAFGLEAGDIVLTGSPPPLAGKRTPLTPGAMLRSAITGIGEMVNPVLKL